MGIFFIRKPQANMSNHKGDRRTSFFIDGFNLYHSIRAAEKQLPDKQLKWLDIPALCQSYLQMIGNGAQLEKVHYFSAYADHLQNASCDKPQRHRKFARALTASGVETHIGKFRRKKVWSHPTRSWIDAYEEKETDVAIACKVLSQAQRDALDVAVLITGDSDFSPLARIFKQDFSNKEIRFRGLTRSIDNSSALKKATRTRTILSVFFKRPFQCQTIPCRLRSSGI